MAYSFESVKEECERLGLTLIGNKSQYLRKEKVLVHCECGGERGVAAFSLFSNSYCCKGGAKLGKRNPSYGKRAWNSGRTDLSGVLTGRPEGSRNREPFSETIRQKYRAARKVITENGQPWSGFRRATEEDREDTLYLILLEIGKYKIGRSYKGANYRKREIKEVIGEWRAKSKYIWEVESTILEEFREYKVPLVERSNGRGMTEWFELTLPVLEVKSRISHLLALRAPAIG